MDRAALAAVGAGRLERARVAGDSVSSIDHHALGVFGLPSSKELAFRAAILVTLGVVGETGRAIERRSLEHSSHLALGENQQMRDRVLVDLTALRDELGRLDLAVMREGSSQVDAYVRFREATDPYIVAYAHNLGYDERDVRAVYGRWARDAALNGATKT